MEWKTKKKRERKKDKGNRRKDEEKREKWDGEFWKQDF
jgi:hypothetical protein